MRGSKALGILPNEDEAKLPLFVPLEKIGYADTVPAGEIAPTKFG